MFELLGCPVVVEPQRLSAVVRTESSGNPFAIGVVGHYLSSQPATLEQAVLVADELKRRGLNYSLGLGQVNQVNFSTYGIDHRNGFDQCKNLSAASKILKKCYDQYGSWGKAYSCYYSGDPRTGFTHGYVNKVNANYNLKEIANTRLPKYNQSISIVKRKSKSAVSPSEKTRSNSPMAKIKKYSF